MTAMLPPQDAPAADLARECLYRFLASLWSDPRTPAGRLARESPGPDLAVAAADLLRDEAQAAPAALAFAELPPDRLDLAACVAALQDPGLDPEAEFVRVFGLVPSPECPPYETEFYPVAEPFFRAQQLADVAGFYRAFGLQVSADQPERPDHLALELGFMAFLLLKRRTAAEAGADPEGERAAVCRQAEVDFFRDHLAWWAPSYAAGLRHRADHGPYAEAAAVLAAFLAAERARLGVPAPRRPLPTEATGKTQDEVDCAGCSAS